MNKALLAALLPCLWAGLVRAETGGSFEPWYPAAQIQDLLDGIKSNPPSNPPTGRGNHACAIPLPGRDSDRGDDAVCVVDLSGGPFGVLRAVKLPAPERQPSAQHQILPINTGFKSMGPAGGAGAIDGPGKQGNGKFKVAANDPFEVSMEVNTGYIAGTVTLARDQTTGKDTMRFAGRRWSDDKWGPYEEKTSDVVIRYDPKNDEGSINWQEEKKDEPGVIEWKSERYWGGGDDDKDMTIEFGGGWDHDFHRD